MAAYIHDSDNSSLAHLESERKKTVIPNGQIISIKRNFGNLSLQDVLGKAVIRQLSQEEMQNQSTPL